MGHMQVGPKLYPRRPRGAQVIQRGPHGHRFSADPVAVRRANPGGNGFSWWSEQIAQAGGDQNWWLPRQRVDGVMGLGAVSPELSQQQNQNFGAFQARATQLFPNTASVIGGVGKLRVLSGGVSDAASATRTADFGVLLREANMIHGGPGSRERGRTIGQLSLKAIRASGAVREDGAPMVTTQVLPNPDDVFNKSLRSELSRQFNPLDRRSADSSSFPWTKLALGVAGVAFAYGFARGVGGNIF